MSASEHINGSHSPLRPVDDEEENEEEEEGVDDYGGTGLETELEVGSMVEVNDPPLFGVIRWIGHLGAVKELVAGIELVSVASASVFLFSLISLDL